MYTKFNRFEIEMTKAQALSEPLAYALLGIIDDITPEERDYLDRVLESLQDN